MKRRVSFIILVLIVLLSIPVSASNEEGVVYIIPIKGEIGPAVEQYVADSIREAEGNLRTTAIIFEIDTYGGRIDSATEISDLMLSIEKPTISLVNKKAISAGVLVTISGDHIVMAPGGSIGSAEPIPNTEKTLSAWRGLLETVAQEQNRDPKLVAAMADKSIEIPDVVAEDKLLNLTSQQAKNLGLADYISNDYEEVLKYFEIEYGSIERLRVPGRVKFAQFFTGAYIAPILLSIGFIGLLIEILTPGFGLGGTASLAAFTLYFGSSILAGYAGWAVLVLFIAGLLLLTVEAFAPGFGVAGIGGIICIVASIIMASNSVATAVTSLVIAFILTIIAFILLLKYAPKNKYFSRIVLSARENPDLGYTASGRKYDSHLGKIGVVKTFLRPAGTILVEDELLDVVSEGDFIEIGSRVKIVKIEGRKIIVRKINEEGL
ncbi:NfeD family protein [Alkaliphilus serpentinus]|uniref:Nodulation protein NfeD n=1 Tax=Alkaliphilus serpentinus TaxID=1482731 RepID=A0A833HRJ7_9FIRM|nr:nodulation protein NfeD [Alkaliphilus serpentinus]KAB3533259.1 nodulation protein NfeD [Alkaliphilus serpentinus]